MKYFTALISQQFNLSLLEEKIKNGVGSE